VTSGEYVRIVTKQNLSCSWAELRTDGTPWPRRVPQVETRSRAANHGRADHSSFHVVQAIEEANRIIGKAKSEVHFPGGQDPFTAARRKFRRRSVIHCPKRLDEKPEWQ
jgi:hypothetical protein